MSTELLSGFISVTIVIELSIIRKMWRFPSTMRADSVERSFVENTKAKCSSPRIGWCFSATIHATIYFHSRLPLCISKIYTWNSLYLEQITFLVSPQPIRMVSSSFRSFQSWRWRPKGRFHGRWSLWRWAAFVVGLFNKGAVEVDSHANQPFDLSFG